MGERWRIPDLVNEYNSKQRSFDNTDIENCYNWLHSHEPYVETATVDLFKLGYMIGVEHGKKKR